MDLVLNEIINWRRPMTEERRLKLVVKISLISLALFAVWLVFVVYNQELIEERQNYIAILEINIVAFIYCVLTAIQTIMTARRRIKELSSRHPGQATQQ